MEGLFAGLDVSTQSCKLVVIDAGNGAVVHVDRVDYDRDLPQYGTENGTVTGLGEGVSESDPTMWIEAVNVVLDRMRDSAVPADAIRGIAVSGQQHGLVALDAKGNLARARSKLWNDYSTTEECEILTAAVGGTEAMIREVSNTQRAGYTAPKILHMRRHERECYDRTTTFFLVHNYVNWYLTGGADGGVKVLEPGDTSGVALWNPKSASWSHRVLAAIDPSLREKLPPVRPSDQSIGTLSKTLAQRFGMSPDCMIDAGSGDNMYGAVGTGNVEPGIVTVSLGTSGTVYTFLEEAFVDPTGEIAAFCDSTGHHLPLLCVSNMANGYDALLDRFQLSHEGFGEMVARTSPGNGGRVLVPWYVGERTPELPLAAPVSFGFQLADSDPEVLCRAVLEGHVLNLQHGFSRMPVKPSEIRLTGGLSQSPSWCQAIADIFEAETVPVVGEGAALGAAIHAAWVWQKEDGSRVSLVELTGRFIECDESRRARPNTGNQSVYRVMKRLFAAISCRIRGEPGEDPFQLRHELIALTAGSNR